jgi:hypothetical protein
VRPDDAGVQFKDRLLKRGGGRKRSFHDGAGDPKIGVVGGERRGVGGQGGGEGGREGGVPVAVGAFQDGNELGVG